MKSMPDDWVDKLDEYVGGLRVNRSTSDGDADGRWILAPEVRYVVLGHYAAAGLYRDEHTFVNPDTDREHQSNRFAGKLLMDSRAIEIHSEGYGAISTRFSVTEAMAIRRIRELVL